MERRRFREAIGRAGERMMKKLQAPSSKLQRSSKSQAPTTRLRYLVGEMVAARAHEAANGNGASRHPFDLEERTACFGEAIVGFAQKIPRSPANDPLAGQPLCR